MDPRIENLETTNFFGRRLTRKQVALMRETVELLLSRLWKTRTPEKRNASVFAHWDVGVLGYGAAIINRGGTFAYKPRRKGVTAPFCQNIPAATRATPTAASTSFAHIGETPRTLARMSVNAGFPAPPPAERIISGKPPPRFSISR